MNNKSGGSVGSNRIKVIDIGKFTVPELIDELQKRPLRWLPEKNIYFLHVFLSGWVHGKSHKGCDLLYEFGRYIEDIYSEKRTIGWAKILEEQTGDVGVAFEKFFEHFSEFQSSLENGT